MKSLTIGERFKDARTVHNQHGKQTMSEVEAATGVKKSLISELENDSEREIGYTKIIALAKHYGVSTDYLLGISDTQSIDTNVKAVMQYTGLTESNVEFLHNPPKVGEEGPLNISRKSLFTLVNDLVELSQAFDVYAPFRQMQRLRSQFEGKPAHNGGFYQLVAEGSAREWGYVALTVNESIAFYSSQLSKAIEQAIINKYSVTQTEEPRGKRKTFEGNGKKIEGWAE